MHDRSNDNRLVYFIITAILYYILAIVWSCTSFAPDGGYWLYNQLTKSVIFLPVSNSNFEIVCLYFVAFENFDIITAIHC